MKEGERAKGLPSAENLLDSLSHAAEEGGAIN
jgi:hypothetical protein